MNFEVTVAYNAGNRVGDNVGISVSNPMGPGCYPPRHTNHPTDSDRYPEVGLVVVVSVVMKITAVGRARTFESTRRYYYIITYCYFEKK